MTELQEEKLYEEMALAVIKILKDNHAIRVADNVNPDGVTLDALLVELEILGFSVSAPVYYNKIRPKCIEMGYSIVANGRGQYIGARGEWTRLLKNTRDQILGRTFNQRKVLTSASEAMTLDEGNKYSLDNFGMDLGTAAKLFKVVGELTNEPMLPWPSELYSYLLEAGEQTTFEKDHAR